MHVDTLALGFAALLVTGVGALGYALVSFARRSDRLEERLAEPTPDMFAPAVTSAVEVQVQRARGLARLLEPISRIAAPVRKEELARLKLRLQQGAIRTEHAVPLFLAAKVTLAMALLGLLFWVNAQRAQPFASGFLLAVVAFASGYYLPDVWLSAKIRARQTAIERGLPDALDLLVTCVEAGLGLDASLQRVSGEVQLAWPVLAGELLTTVLEVKAGIPRIEAFRRLASRTGVADLKSLAGTLAQTEVFGTSVALALRIQAEGIRVRRMQRAEERAAYVSVKMTIPLILCILPSLMAVVIGPAMLNVARNLLPVLGGGR